MFWVHREHPNTMWAVAEDIVRSLTSRRGSLSLYDSLRGGGRLQRAEH